MFALLPLPPTLFLPLIAPQLQLHTYTTNPLPYKSKTSKEKLQKTGESRGLYTHRMYVDQPDYIQLKLCSSQCRKELTSVIRLNITAYQQCMMF